MSGISQGQKEKQLSFIQRFYPFGSSNNAQQKEHDSPKAKKIKHTEIDEENYSVQKLKQYWNNRITTSQNQAQIIREKSATLGSRRSPDPASGFIRRNSLRSSNSRKSIVRSKLIPLYSENNNNTNNSNSKKSEIKVCENVNKSENNKRTSLEISPIKEKVQKSIKKFRPDSGNFPIAVLEAGGKIHWAKRAEIMGIRAIAPNEEKEVKMGVEEENSLNSLNQIDDDASKEELRDSLGSKNSTISIKSVASSKQGRMTPVRNVSFKTQTHLTPFNKKLLSGNGNKVAALTNRFNKLIQQDAAILEEVKKRGGYVHKGGGHIYKIKEDSADIISKKKTNQKKESDSSDELSLSGKNSYRKPSVKRRPSLKKLRNDEERTSICVKEALQIFEANSNKTNGDLKKGKTVKAKPKVPDKSEQVIQKTKELKSKKIKCDNISEKVVEAKSDKKEILENKSTCQKLYEKFLFRSSKKIIVAKETPMNTLEPSDLPDPPVLAVQPAQPSEEVISREIVLEERITTEEPMVEEVSEPISEPEQILEETPDQKIIDAINSVQQKIDHLSKSFSDLNTFCDLDAPKIQPNASFLFRSTSRASTTSSNSQTNLAEAVNSILINKSVSMDNFPCVLDTSENKQESVPMDVDTENEYEDVSTKTPEIQFEINTEFLELTNRIESFVYKSHDKSKEESENIYQSLLQVREKEDTLSINSYESFENYETVDNMRSKSPPAKSKIEDEYEICDPPEPPPPRKISEQTTSSQNDLTLPMPKRNLSGSPKIPPKHEHYQSNYEKIKYDKIPPRPPKLVEQVPLPPRNTIFEDDPINLDYEENIYDTIKNIDSSCYESVQKRNKHDTLSLSSNCYESIISSKIDFPRLHSLRLYDAESLNSDHNTNSLYGTTGVQSLNPPSERGSDSSSDWVDITDDEEEQKQSFVVIRERNKCHRTPLWSRKVRDQQLHQQKTDDDSDHHYESLSSMVVKKSQQSPKTTPKISTSLNDTNFSTYRSACSDNTLHENDDDFDSFESDNETDDDFHKKHDSGVDISNAKLPDPPQTYGQVYGLMQKLKSFGTLSKSEITKGFIKIAKKKSPSSKSLKINIDAPVVDEGRVYENAMPTKPTRNKFKNLKLPLRTAPKSSDPYENTEFHKPITPTSPNIPVSSLTSDQSDKSAASSNTESTNNIVAERKKSKSGKSFKSKLRKSFNTESSLNLGSSLDGGRSTFYLDDMDSGIFNGSEQNSSSSNINLTVTNEKEIATLKTPEGRRKSSSPTNRPTNPPPPPPVNSDKKKQDRSTATWYESWGVFKKDAEGDGKKDITSSSTFWYAQAGLYETSGASVASSSESSGVSTGGEGGPGDDHSHSMFSNEPLYQIYNAAKLESISRDIEAVLAGNQESYDDGYEKIGGKIPQEEEKKYTRPTALELIEPNHGPSRTLWCEIPEVINSEILSTLTPTEKKVQEAKFEVLTSEASYLKSLNLLKTHFMNHPAFRNVEILSSSDRKILFSHIIPVQECSDRLLCDLENCWQDNIMLLGLSESIFKHAEKHFHVYISYCEYQAKIERTLRRLKDTKPAFVQALELLESDGTCCGLSLSSFLMLPMQRITRMRLLIDAVLSKIDQDDDEFEEWEKTFILINQILSKCNEAAHKCEQMFEMETLSQQIQFPTHIRALAIVPVGVNKPGSLMRKLEKKGEMTQLIWRGDDAKLTFGKKLSKSSVYAFLFTDLFVLTKKKCDDSYLVIDYCPRALLSVTSGDVIPQLPTKEMSSVGKNLIIMTLLENYEGKTIEMILACPSETERQRWLKVTEPLTSNNPDEKLYEQWDCPQVIAKHPYQALQPDELSLDLGDIVNVSRKMADGWYEGERIRDGVQGWFPGNYSEEILTPHIRAKHIKQRHILLTYTAKHLDTTKNNRKS